MGTRTKAKQALPFKRRSSYLAYPEDLYLEKREGHKHYDPRVHYAPVERDVVWIMKPGHGVHKAVLVEKMGDKIAVVDGRQRVINALEANRRLQAEGVPRIMIPVAPKRGDAKSMFQIRVITNKHRRNDDPVVEAHTMQQYINMGHNEEDCAELWGCTRRTVLNRLHLLELCPEVQQAISAGKTTVGRALKLRDLSYEEQKKALERKPPPAKPRRPSLKKALGVVNFSGNGALSSQPLLPPIRAAILWATGQISDEEAARKIKGFKKALEGTT